MPSFCALVYRLSHPSTPKGLNKPPSPAEIFSSWLNHLPRPFPPGTGKHILRLLFPHEGSRRRYGLKETRLAIDLERILCVEGLCRWDAVGWGEGGSGSLGKEVERAMRDRVSGRVVHHRLEAALMVDPHRSGVRNQRTRTRCPSRQARGSFGLLSALSTALFPSYHL